MHANAKAQHSTARGGGLLLLKHLHALFAARGSGAIRSARGRRAAPVSYLNIGGRGYAPLVHLLAVASKGGVARGGSVGTEGGER